MSGDVQAEQSGDSRIHRADPGGRREAAREPAAMRPVRLVVRRQLPKLLRSRFDSLDFVQSVWGSFFHRVRTGPTDIEDEPNLVAFLAWAARNKVVDEYRRASSQKHDVRREEPLWDRAGEPREVLASAADTPSQLVEAQETLQRLQDQVPKERRKVLELKAAGFSCREIGERLAISERTVQRLIESLRERADDDSTSIEPLTPIIPDQARALEDQRMIPDRLWMRPSREVLPDRTPL